MKVLKPFYYDNFKCVANECKESCCSGWSIDIDKKSYYKYKKVNGNFSEKLKKGISRNRASVHNQKYGKMNIVANNGKCQFLNKENLCDLYINLGGDYLCNTCKAYPRVIEKYGHIYERNLCASCPVVAETLVKLTEPLNFLLTEETINDLDKEYLNENQKYNVKLYDILWKGRALSIEIAQVREIKLWKRLMFIVLSEEKIQKNICESLDKNIDDVIFTLKDAISDVKINKILDNIKSVPKVKILFTNSIISMNIRKNFSGDTFIRFINEFNEFISRETKIINSSDSIDKEGDFLRCINNYEKDFDNYIENKEYILENYVVYNLYGNYMKALYTKDLHREIIRLVISYSLIKKMLIGRWIKNNKTLEEEDFMDAIYSFSRKIEHNEQFINRIYKNIKNAGYDSMAYLLMLVK